MARDRQGAANSTPGPSTGASTRPAGPVLTVDEVMDYGLCPLMYAFKHVYRVVDQRPLSGSEVFGQALRSMFLWTHTELHQNRPLTWGAMVKKWDKVWGDCSTDLDLGSATAYMARGIRHVRELFEKLPNSMCVLGCSYPCEREVNGYVLAGSVDVIRMIETRGAGKSGRTTQLIIVDDISTATPDPFVANLRLDLIIGKYGLESELRKDFAKLSNQVESMLYLPRIPKLAAFDINGKAARHAYRWVVYIVESIRQGLFFPRAGSYCAACLYKPVCNVKYISDRALSNPNTPDEIRREL